MVWHIVRKDWKLLWRMVVAVALINAMQRAIAHAPFSPQGSRFLLMLESVSLLAVALLIVMAVQQDAIPGLRQDWLVRPIRRRDLLLSKLVLVVLFVQAPIFLAEVCQCLAAGFPLRQSLTAPLCRSLWMLFVLDLPVLAFATLTRSLAQASGAAIAFFLGYVVFVVALAQSYPELIFNDRSWVNEVTQALWGVLAVAGVMALQYFRRMTARARWLYGAATVVWISLQFLPWKMAFAVEKRISPDPAAANPIQVAFVSGVGKYHSLDGEPSRINAVGSRQVVVSIRVPMRVDGLSQKEVLMSERMTARLIEPGGATSDLYSLPAESQTQSFTMERNGGYQRVWVPEDLYNNLRDRAVAIEIDYSFALLQQDPQQIIPANGGDRWLADMGHCTTKASATGKQIELACLIAGKPPCVTWRLENKLTARLIAMANACDDGFSPFFGRINGDSIGHFGTVFQTAPQDLDKDQVVLQTYWLLAHFTRRLAIPNIRLSDWTPE